MVNQFDNSDVINTINEIIVVLKMYEKRKIIKATVYKNDEVFYQNFFSKYDKIQILLCIWLNLVNKSLTESFIFLCSKFFLSLALYFIVPSNKVQFIYF